MVGEVQGRKRNRAAEKVGKKEYPGEIRQHTARLDESRSDDCGVESVVCCWPALGCAARLGSRPENNGTQHAEKPLLLSPTYSLLQPPFSTAASAYSLVRAMTSCPISC